MYNENLTTFVCVADYGSFNKAAEKLYISSTAVIKQINTLEKHLNLQLFYRSNQGIKLTPQEMQSIRTPSICLNFPRSLFSMHANKWRREILSFV